MEVAPGSRPFFEAVCAEAHRRGRLRMVELTVGGGAVATKCDFRGGDGAFMFKIAYDEAHARHSPGLLLELYAMRQLTTGPDPVAWVDSCAQDGHFMAERLWSGRRVLADWDIAGPRLLGRTAVRHGDRLRAVSERIRVTPGQVRPADQREPERPRPRARRAPTGPVRVDPARLLRDFDRQPFLVEHDLCDHPLLQLPRLVELARSLPGSSVEWNSGDLAVGQAAELDARGPASASRRRSARSRPATRGWS